MPFLIAEIGQMSGGSIEKSKELIRAAHEHGADIVKSQAFNARDIRNGSMPFGWYKSCERTFKEHVDLIEYARSIGTDLFYSIFSRDYEDLSYYQRYHKTAGGQTKLGFKNLKKKDCVNMIVSIPEMSVLPDLKKAQILSVTPYMCTKPNLAHIDFLRDYYDRDVGLSDHCIGTNNCLKAIDAYGVTVIEKHFTLDRNVGYGSQIHRDCLHAAMPDELEEIKKALTGG